MDAKKIAQAYKDVQDSVLLEMINKETLNAIREGMEKRLPEYKIKCDYKVIVRISDPKTLNYINLTF